MEADRIECTGTVIPLGGHLFYFRGRRGNLATGARPKLTGLAGCGSSTYMTQAFEDLRIVMASKTFDPRDLFKAAQSPTGWLLSAEHLRDGAESILGDELPHEGPYFRAHDEAVKHALAIACSDGNESGTAEVRARPH